MLLGADADEDRDNVLCGIVCGLILLTLVFEWGKDKLFEVAGESLRGIVRVLFAELTVLGFIGLCTFIAVKTGVTETTSRALFGKPEVFKEILEDLHMTLFFVMTLFLFQVVVLIMFSKRNERRWQQAEEFDEECSQIDNDAVGREQGLADVVARRWAPDSEHIETAYRVDTGLIHNLFTAGISDCRFIALKEQFCYFCNKKRSTRHHITPDFKLAVYFGLYQAKMIEGIVEISREVWLVVILLVGLLRGVLAWGNELGSLGCYVGFGISLLFITDAIRRRMIYSLTQLTPIPLSIARGAALKAAAVAAPAAAPDATSPPEKTTRRRRRSITFTGGRSSPQPMAVQSEVQPPSQFLELYRQPYKHLPVEVFQPSLFSRIFATYDAAHIKTKRSFLLFTGHPFLGHPDYQAAITAGSQFMVQSFSLILLCNALYLALLVKAFAALGLEQLMPAGLQPHTYITLACVVVAGMATPPLLLLAVWLPPCMSLYAVTTSVEDMTVSVLIEATKRHCKVAQSVRCFKLLSLVRRQATSMASLANSFGTDSDEDPKEIIKTLPKEQLLEARDVFEMYDADQQGFIEFEEFVDIVNYTAKGMYTEEQVRSFFDKIDRDSSGSIDESEFTVFYVKSIKPLPPKEECKLMFSMIDDDESGDSRCDSCCAVTCANDCLLILLSLLLVLLLTRVLVFRQGSITRAELTGFISNVDSGMSKDDIFQLVAEADSDGSGHVEIEEFTRMILKHSDF